ncbi:MAG: hypothetical protein KAG84_08860 [Bacteroidales bacterium]|nr:hypothetical protein [Bacteroidales bacterium]
MEQRDFLMKEIEQLSQILAKLIGKVVGLSSVNFEVEIKEVNDALVSQFHFGLENNKDIDHSKFIEKIKSVDKSNIELLLKLLSEIVNKTLELEKVSNSNIKDLCTKGILIIDHIDTITKTFSIDRMKMKTQFEELISKY